MKYNKVLILPFVLLGLFVTFYFINSKSIKNEIPSKNDSTQVIDTDLQTQEVEIGDVTYQITPKKFKPSDETWEFEITLDTHSGSLDQDLVALVSISDSQGIEYQANKWIGDPPEGHHRKGILEFLPITPYPSSIDLKIQTTTSQDIILNWNL